MNKAEKLSRKNEMFERKTMMKRKKEKNDPNKLPKNFGKLMYAGDYDGIKEIFKTCSLEATFGFEEVTAIFFATMAGTDEMMEWLAEQGADINARDRWGQTPLHAIMWVTKYEPLHRMELLIRLGADIHAVMPEGETPLHYAAGEGKLQSVKMSVENNADIYAENKRGENPMEYMLAKAYYRDICRIFPVAGYFLSIGVPVREKAVRSVRGLAVSFEFYRAAAYQKGLAIREIVHKEQILHPEKLCELSVRWIQKNPDPIPLRITFYSS